MNNKTLLSISILLLVFGITTNTEASNNDLATVSVSDTTEVYNVVDEMPEIKGGLQEVYKHIQYPAQARRANVEGRVFIKFIIDESGKVVEPKILKDIGAGCGDAAIKGIKKVEFTPGKNNGQPVKVYYTLPITFKLEN
jgi:protein TonB